jgi:hypothetical protein
LVSWQRICVSFLGAQETRMPLNVSDWDFQGLDSELQSSDCKGMSKAELGGGVDSVADDDVIDKLPIDPFGMDINSTITITGWFQNLGVESDWDFDGFGVDEDEKEFDDHHGLFAGLNWVWNGSMRVEPESSNVKIGGISIPCDGFDSLGSFGNWVVGKGAQESMDCGKTCSDGGEGGAPHDAMFFALAYLGVQDLLNVERVCKYLRDGVRNDPLLWRSIHIDQPLSEKITDDALLKLASRAQGNLQCLNLVGCTRITDGGLKHVLETNPKMTKVRICNTISWNRYDIWLSYTIVNKYFGVVSGYHW